MEVEEPVSPSVPGLWFHWNEEGRREEDGKGVLVPSPLQEG